MSERSGFNIQVVKGLKVPLFEYLYMVVMVVYMAQINESTARMFAGLSGNPIPLLLPIVLTIILLLRNWISFKCLNLWIILGVLGVWSLAVLAKYSAFTETADLSYIFFQFYAVIIAYIHIRVYKKNLFYIFEHIMVLASSISIPFWLINILTFGSYEPSFLPETSLGYNVLYLYNWISPHFDNIEELFLISLRNPGFSWEPGRFAIMINLAMFVNLCRHGVKLKGNTNMLIFLVALASTQSTTGYIIAIMLFLIFAFKIKLKNILVFLSILILAFFAMTRLEFMRDKIVEQLDVQSTLTKMAAEMQYHNETLPEGEHIASLGRFQSLFFDSMNMLNDPILGYSRNTQRSFFYENITTHYSLPSGLVKVLAQYGIPVGIFIYFLLVRSSFRVASVMKINSRYALALLLIASSVSYEVWCVPIFTAFWLFGLFYPSGKQIINKQRE